MSKKTNILPLLKKPNEEKFQGLDEQRPIIQSLLKTLKFKDPYTFAHSTRVAHYSLLIAKELGLKKEQLQNIELAALFHDIGKIGIPDAILNKPFGLDEEEFTLMKKHPEFSYEIIKDIPGIEEVKMGVLHHHERFDGRGYPANLKSDDIPIISRIITVADSYDAMTSTRSYRKGLPKSVAMEELFKFSGKQFDADLVKAFMRGMRKNKNNSSNFQLSFIEGEFAIAA